MRLKVLTELELADSQKGLSIDPNDQAFARHLTENYSAYAKEFPAFACLKELAKITAIAKLLVNQKVSLDIGTLFESPPISVATPGTTPSIIRSESKQNGNVTHHQHMSGGVDMEQDPVILADSSGAANQLQQVSRLARPAGAQEWRFQSGGISLAAKALPLGGSTPFRRTSVDHQFPALSGQSPLALKRVYKSSRLDSGQFGPGWSLFLPFTLTVLPPSGKRQEVLGPEEAAKRKGDECLLLLRDATVGTTSFYRPLNDGTTPGTVQFGKVTSQSVSKTRVSFQCDLSDTIQKQNGQFHVERGGSVYVFDEIGRLGEIRSVSTGPIRYVWQNDRLARIENGAGQSYTFTYDPLDSARITGIKASDGQNFQYLYDAGTCLRRVKQGQTIKESYGYDLSGLLAQVRDANNTAIAGTSYDCIGRPLTVSSDKIGLPFGSSVTRSFDDGFLVFLTDDRGARGDLAYGPQGQVTEIAIKNRSGDVWRFGYDASGLLRRSIDPLNRATELSTDNHDLIAQAVFPDKRSFAAKRDLKGRLLEFRTPDAHVWNALPSLGGLPSGFSGSEGLKITCVYTDGVLSGLEAPGATFALDHRTGASRLTVRPPVGDHLLKTTIASGTNECIFGRQKQRITRAEGGFVLENAAGRLSLTTRTGDAPGFELLFH